MHLVYVPTNNKHLIKAQLQQQTKDSEKREGLLMHDIDRQCKEIIDVSESKNRCIFCTDYI